MINVSEVVNDPDFQQGFQIERSTGVWQYGVWVSTTVTIQGKGVITVATARDLDMVPEGDIVKGAMVFHSEAIIYGTHALESGEGGSSDLLIWRGKKWRVLSVGPYVDYGYYRATATRIDTV